MKIGLKLMKLDPTKISPAPSSSIELRTAILATATASVPILDHQLTTGGIIHGGVGRNEILTR